MSTPEARRPTSYLGTLRDSSQGASTLLRRGEHAVVELDGDSLTITSASGTHRFPLQGLVVSSGKTHAAEFVLTHPTVAACAVHSREWQLLDALVSVGDVEVSEGAARARGARSGDSRRLWLIIAVIAVCLMMLLRERSSMMQALVRFVPYRIEERAGDILFAGVRDTVPILENAEAEAALRTIAQPVTSLFTRRGIHAKLFISSDEIPNAFVLPGGYIILTSGLLRLIEKPEEILALVAHECAHLEHRHTAKQLAAVDGLSWALDLSLRNPFGSVVSLGTKAPRLLERQYSLPEEADADNTAFSVLSELNVDPHGLPNVVRELDDFAPQAREKGPLPFAVVHPGDPQERVERMHGDAEGPIKPHSFNTQPAEPLQALKRALPAGH